MSTALQLLLEETEHCLKRNLKIDEVLTHRNHGPVVFTEACAEMEKRDGTHDTIFADHNGEIKEFSLTSIERLIEGKGKFRMRPLWPDLEKKIKQGHRLLGSFQVQAVEPLMNEIKKM